jgi:hypothetical protein
MAKRVTMLQTSAEPSENAPAAEAPDPAAESLEQRVQRLEDAVAALQDTRPLEERVVERVSQRLGITPPKPEPEPEPRTDYMASAARRTPPPGDGLPAPDVAALPSRPAPPALLRHPWLLFDLLGELRAMVRMFFDVRYHVAWSTRVTVLVLLPLIFTSGWWCPFAYIPILGPLVEKVVDLVLAFFTYKALSREARRYRDLREAAALP